MQAQPHTPIPWQIDRDVDGHGTPTIHDAKGHLIAAMAYGPVDPATNADANADFAVLAVNSHDELVEAFAGLLATARVVDAGNKAAFEKPCGFAPVLLDRCESLIARAKGGAK